MWTIGVTRSGNTVGLSEADWFKLDHERTEKTSRLRRAGAACGGSPLHRGNRCPHAAAPGGDRSTGSPAVSARNEAVRLAAFRRAAPHTLAFAHHFFAFPRLWRLLLLPFRLFRRLAPDSCRASAQRHAGKRRPDTAGFDRFAGSAGLCHRQVSQRRAGRSLWRPAQFSRRHVRVHPVHRALYAGRRLSHLHSGLAGQPAGAVSGMGRDGQGYVALVFLHHLWQRHGSAQSQLPFRRCSFARHYVVAAGAWFRLERNLCRRRWSAQCDSFMQSDLSA